MYTLCKERSAWKSVGSAILHTAHQATRSDQAFVQTLLTQCPRMTRAYNIHTINPSDPSCSEKPLSSQQTGPLSISAACATFSVCRPSKRAYAANQQLDFPLTSDKSMWEPDSSFYYRCFSRKLISKGTCAVTYPFSSSDRL